MQPLRTHQTKRMYKHKIIVVSSIKKLEIQRYREREKKSEIVIGFSGLGKVKVTEIPKRRDEIHGVSFTNAAFVEERKSEGLGSEEQVSCF